TEEMIEAGQLTHQNVFQGNNVHDFGWCGISPTGAQETLVRGNTIHDCFFVNPNGLATGTGIQLKGYVDELQVVGNSIHDLMNAGGGAILLGGSTYFGCLWQAYDMVVNNNTIWNITGAYAVLVSAVGGNSTFSNNVIFNSTFNRVVSQGEASAVIAFGEP